MMDYRKLRPVRQFLQWVRSQDERQMLSKAVIGGFFTYPPPPISMETYMKDRRGESAHVCVLLPPELTTGVRR